MHFRTKSNDSFLSTFVCFQFVDTALTFNIHLPLDPGSLIIECASSYWIQELCSHRVFCLMLCRSKELKAHGSELLMWTACQICRHLHTISSLLSNILHAFHFRHLPECVALHLGTRIASMRMLGSSWELTRIFDDLPSVDLQIWIRIHVQIIAFLVHRYFEVGSIAPEFVLETATLLVVYVFAKYVSGRHG